MSDFWSKLPSIAQASHHIAEGGVVAYPTEAVWGLGCDPFNEEAVYKILHLKNRPVEKGVILIASAMHQLDFILDSLTNEQCARLEKTWPGPVSWIVPNTPEVPHWICGNHPGVAVRVSAHPVVKALCDRYGGPIVSTSANPQAKPAAKTAWQVRRYFGRSPYLSMITQGSVGKRNRPSDIIDLLSEKTVRA